MPPSGFFTNLESLRSSPAAQFKLARARTHMIWFDETNDHYLKPEDHNHLRITRIIRTLRLLIRDREADGFRRRIEARIALEAVPISTESLRYWSAA